MKNLEVVHVKNSVKNDILHFFSDSILEIKKRLTKHGCSDRFQYYKEIVQIVHKKKDIALLVFFFDNEFKRIQFIAHSADNKDQKIDENGIIISKDYIEIPLYSGHNLMTHISSGEIFFYPVGDFLSLIVSKEIRKTILDYYNLKPEIKYYYFLIKKSNIIIGLSSKAIVEELLPAFKFFSEYLEDIWILYQEKNRSKAILRNLEEANMLLAKASISLDEAALIVEQKTLKVINCNQSVDMIFDWDKEKIIGKELGDLIKDKSDYKLFKDDMDEALKIEGFHHAEIKMKKAKGKDFYAELTITEIKGENKLIVGLLCIVKDITERKLVEEELRSSKERLSILFEYAPDAYYISDLKGYFLDGNKKVEELIGYSKDEIIGKSIFKMGLLSYSQLPKAAKAIVKNKAGKMMGPDEFIIRHKEGIFIPIEICSYPIRIKDQQVVLGIARDIRLRKKAEEEKRELEEQLRQIQKLEAIGQLAGGIAHDYNNMIGAIVGFTELIRRRYAEKDEVIHKYCAKIVDTSKRAAELTSKLLAFAHKGKYRMVQIDFNNVLTSFIKRLIQSVPDNIVIHQKLNVPSAFILGDRIQLDHILHNIAENAVEAMPDGGELTFSSDIVKIDEKNHPHAVTNGLYLKIGISDTGEGIDKALQSRIFEPFFSTKEKGKTSGLGLASAYGSVNSHNGFITLESETGKGSCFNLFFPILLNKHEEKGDN